MATVKWLARGLLLVLMMAVIPHPAPSGALNDALIRKLFEDSSRNQESTRGLSEIRWERGSFTRAGASEAVVAFYDGNQCHACGWSEVWLLRYTHGWQATRRLADSDRVSFQVIDIEGDGKSEIWIETSDGNQGAFSSEGQLLTLEGDAISVMYINSGHDNRGAGVAGEAVRAHAVEFRDLDHDGILEIVDTETREFYRWTGERWASDYVQTWAETHVKVLKREGARFIEVAAPDISAQLMRL